MFEWLVVSQAEPSDVLVANGHSDADVTDASVARGGDETAQTHSRHSTRTSAASASTAGSLYQISIIVSDGDILSTK